MNGLRRGAAILGFVATTTLLGGAALADHLRVQAEVTVGQAEKVEQGYALSVKLRTSDGRPLNDTIVSFHETVELFGTREMLIATARTDGQGLGSAIYLPARTGRHEIVVRTAGGEHVAPLELRHSFEAIVAAPPYRAHEPPLASFSAAVPYGVGVVVLSVWALIAFALLGTAGGVLRGGRGGQGAQVTGKKERVNIA